MTRPDGRAKDEMRAVKLTTGFTMYAEGSVLAEMGNTRVICTASVEEKVPPFLEGKGLGWVTAEYAMLPRSTNTRKKRDIKSLKLDGRSARRSASARSPSTATSFRRTAARAARPSQAAMRRSISRAESWSTRA